MIKVKLKQNTLIAKIASKFMKAKKGEAVAVTIGKSIHLYGITPKEFAFRGKFLRHEMQHIIQFQMIKHFWIKYIIEIIKKGYSNNKYELEAEEKSNDEFPSGYLCYSKDVLLLKNGLLFIPTAYGINQEFNLKFEYYPVIIYV